MRKEVWFGLTIMAAVVVTVFALMPAPSQMTNGHLGLLMLALIVIAIMLGFPTAFTLMGMGVGFAWLAYRSQDPALAMQQTLDLMVQRAYAVMSNDVLISIPLFVFMGYLVERSNLIEKLFKSLHLALARIPASLAVATLVTCAVFATATGIVGAVVTLMGLLAMPAMLRAGYNIKVTAGVITAGGCLGILIPPSVMLIVYGAVAGRVRRAALCRCLLSRDHAGRALHRLRDDPRQDPARSRAAAADERARRRRCLRTRRRFPRRSATRCFRDFSVRSGGRAMSPATDPGKLFATSPRR